MQSNVRASLVELLCMGSVGEAGAFSQSKKKVASSMYRQNGSGSSFMGIEALLIVSCGSSYYGVGAIDGAKAEVAPSRPLV